MRERQRERALTPSWKLYQKQSRVNNCYTWWHCRKSRQAAKLIATGLDQDCSQHPRINHRREIQLGLRSGRGEEVGKEGDATWHDCDASSWARRKKVRDRQEVNPILGSRVSTTIHERAFAPSMNKQPVLLLFRTLSFVTSSLPLSLPLCLSVCFLLPSGYSIFLFLIFFSSRSRFWTERKRWEREREREEKK